MQTTASALKEKRATRYVMLRHVYERTQGSPWKIVPFFDLASEFGIEDVAAREAFDYLGGERLLKPMTFGGGVSITHAGVREIEAPIERPTQDTTHFQSPTFNFYGPVGGVQSGGHDQMTVNSVAGRPGGGDDVAVVLRALRPFVDQAATEDRVNAGVLLSALEEEAAKAAPNPSLFRALAGGLGRMLPSPARPLITDAVTRIAGTS